MKVYAIRHIPSGGYLPPLPKGYRYGFTHVEPTTARAPRIFDTERSAANALAAWLRGRATRPCPSPNQLFEGTVITAPLYEPTPYRRAEDMEVVPMRLLDTRVEAWPDD